MRLSESLRKTFGLSLGCILNKYKLKKRRVTLFFEDIGASYIRFCEREGFQDLMYKIGQDWMGLYCSSLMPDFIRGMKVSRIINKIINPIWQNLGLLDSITATEDGDKIYLEVKNEGLTRRIGKNKFMVGFYSGLLMSLSEKKMKILDFKQTKKKCEYVFRKTSVQAQRWEGRDRIIYEKLNKEGKSAHSFLEEAFKKRIFLLKGNNVYFNKKLLSPIETTLFHLIGHKGIYLEKVSEISYRFLRAALKKGQKDLIFFKNLLQMMGWGDIMILEEKGKINFEISNPPYGLYKEDNWRFLAEVIKGYLKLKSSCEIASIRESPLKISIKYFCS